MDPRHRAATWIVTALLAVPIGAGAQQASAGQPAPGAVALRHFSCPSASLQSGAGTLNGLWGQLAQGLVNEGLLLDHQIWVREWGDEWNLVEYFSAEDPDALEYALEELELRFQVRDTEGRQARSFDTLCPHRRDNLFSVLGEIP